MALETVGVISYLAMLLVALGRMASVREFWFDELFTLHLAREPLALLNNLRAGVDLNPPLSYLATWCCTQLLGETRLALRLPAMLGAVVGVACVYAFVRHRRGPLEAMVAMLAIGTTAPVWIFFVEARPYGMLVGVTGVSVLAWQRQWRGVGCIAGVIGIGVHYYFVVPLMALSVAQLMRGPKAWREWLPMASAGVALALLAPIWMVAPKVYAPGFWAKVKLTRSAIDDAYTSFATRDLVVPLVGGLLAAVLAGTRRNLSDTSAEYPRAEVVLIVALAAAPMLGVVVGAKLTGAFFYRYTLPGCLGLAMLFALVVGRTARASAWGYCAAAGACLASGAAIQWRDGPNHFRAESTALVATADLVNAHTCGDTIIVESPFEFARVWHQALVKNVVYLADVDRARRATRADTVDRGMIALSTITPVPLLTFDDCRERLLRGEAIMYLGSRSAWQATDLAAAGVRFEPTACDRLFRITLIHASR